ncbi:hypothetical protein FLA_1436 [Filimonas lacunae]|nr:hypothetical protein FLA_1436 [Filimonas lacunae]
MNKLHYVLLALVAGFTACSKNWDDHNAVSLPGLTSNLAVHVSTNAGISRFYELLVKSGYDKVIAGSKSYTVWAPDNTALQNLDASLINDSAALRRFVAGHISNQSYTTGAATVALSIATLNGKYQVFTATGFEEANIEQADEYASNGVLHVIDRYVTPRLSIWEYLATTSSAQKDYLHSLDYSATDSTGVAYVANTYTDKTAVNEEAGKFTFFILADEGWNLQLQRLQPFFATDSAAYTLALTQWALAKNLVVKGAYAATDLPDTLVSVSGVKVPVNKAAITASYKASNGYVHVIGNIPFRLQDQFPAIVVQGESPSGFSRTDKYANIFYRSKADAAGNTYNDIMAYGYQVAQFYIYYSVKQVPAAKYKVYWRAVAGNYDSQTITFQQRIAFNNWETVSLPYTTVTLNNYDEVYLGEYTTTRYGNNTIYLVAANTATTGQNTLTLDYLKLVPVTE